MFPDESDEVIGLGMDDANVNITDVVSNSDVSDDEADEEPLLSADRDNKKNDTREVDSVNSSKKRVHFLPDGFLVRVHEIPARNSNSASQSDGSDSESSAESDDSASDTDSKEIVHADDSVPQFLQTSTTITKGITFPPSNALKLTETTRPTSAVKHTLKQTTAITKITGVQSSSPTPTFNSVLKQPKAKTSRKSSKKAHRARKQNEKTSGDKTSLDDTKRSRALKKHILSTSELPKNNQFAIKNPTNSDKALVPNRIISARPKEKTAVRRSQASTVSTSLTILNEAKKDISSDRVVRSMQSLSVGQLYTMNGINFPPTQTADVHLPELLLNNRKRESIINNGKWDSMTLSSTHGSDIKTPTSDHTHYQQHIHSQLIPSQLPSSNDRYKAWQMANGSIQDTLQNTPSIAQLWDTDHYVSSDDSNRNAYLSVSTDAQLLHNIIKKT